MCVQVPRWGPRKFEEGISGNMSIYVYLKTPIKLGTESDVQYLLRVLRVSRSSFPTCEHRKKKQKATKLTYKHRTLYWNPCNFLGVFYCTQRLLHLRMWSSFVWLWPSPKRGQMPMPSMLEAELSPPTVDGHGFGPVFWGFPKAACLNVGFFSE